MVFPKLIGSMYGIYANIWGILMVNVTIYSIHGSYGYGIGLESPKLAEDPSDEKFSTTGTGQHRL